MYAHDSASGHLTHIASVGSPRGKDANDGPRHVKIYPNGNFLYCLTEHWKPPSSYLSWSLPDLIILWAHIAFCLLRLSICPQGLYSLATYLFHEPPYRTTTSEATPSCFRPQRRPNCLLPPLVDHLQIFVDGSAYLTCYKWRLFLIGTQ